MPVEIIESTGAMFVLWGRPNPIDVARLSERLHAAVARNAGPILYVTRVPAGAPAPDASTRKHLNAAMPLTAECCSSYHVVMEGTGFGAAVKRGVLLSLFQLTQRRGLFHVHANCDDLLRHVSTEEAATVRNLLNRARSQGLLDGHPLASLAPRGKADLRKTG